MQVDVNTCTFYLPSHVLHSRYIKWPWPCTRGRAEGLMNSDSSSWGANYSSRRPALLPVNGISMEPKVPQRLILGHCARCNKEERKNSWGRERSAWLYFPILHFCLLHNTRCISCLSKFRIKQYFYCACQYPNKYADFHDLLIDLWHFHGTDQLLPHPCWAGYWFMVLMHSKLIFMRSICGYTFKLPC